MKYLRHVLKESKYEVFPGVYTHLNPDAAKKVLTPYKEIILKNSDIKIYRGMGIGTKFPEDFLFGEGSKIVRKSANTTNFYTNMMSHMLPKWKPFPRRDNSFICSSDFYRAHSYGGGYGGDDGTFIGIPLENQLIAVCPEEDLWDSFADKIKKYFKNSSGYTSVLNTVIDDLDSEYIKIGLDDYTPEKYNMFFKKATKLLKTPNESLIDFMVGYSGLKSLALYIQQSGKSLYDVVEDILDPKKFGLMNVQEYMTKQRNFKNNEVWLTGKVLFIKYERFAEALAFVEKL